MKQLIVSTLIAFVLNTMTGIAYAQSDGQYWPGCTGSYAGTPQGQGGLVTSGATCGEIHETFVYVNAYVYEVENQRAQGAPYSREWDIPAMEQNATYAVTDWRAGGGHYQSETWMTQPPDGTPYMGNQQRGPWGE